MKFRNSRLIKTLLAGMIISAATPLLSASDKELDKQGTQWAPFLEWTLSNPTFTGNPFDLKATVTFQHEDGRSSHNSLLKNSFLGRVRLPPNRNFGNDWHLRLSGSFALPFSTGC